MKIYIARHGQTNYNDLNLCNSDPVTDVHLVDLGIQQADALADRLKNAAIDHIFVSELKRTLQTAEIINKFHNAPITKDARLNDNRSGFEDKPSSEYYAALEQAENKWKVRLNGGESIEDYTQRARSFLDELRTKDYGAVLIVTSRVIVQAMYGIVNGLTLQEAWDFEVARGSCFELEVG